MNEVNAVLRLQVREEVTSQMKKASQELEKFRKQTSSTQQVVKALFQEFAVPLTIGGAVATVTALARESLRLGTALADTERQARMVFGEAFPRMKQAAEDMAQTMRRSESDILHYMAGFGDFLDQLGTGPEQVEDMSGALAALTVSYGKLKQSIPDEQIYSAVQQGLLGNYRALKSLDVAIKDDTLQQYANSLAIRNKVKDMDAEQEATLITLFLLDDVKKKQYELALATGTAGDTAKTAEAAWQDLLEEIGKDIGPIAAAGFDLISHALHTMTRRLELAMDAFGAMKSMVAGSVLAGAAFGAGGSLANPANRAGTGVAFGPAKPEWMSVDADALVADLNRTPHKASGGGGGGSEAKKGLTEAKQILSEIEKINKEITAQLGEQAEANKKLKEGLRDDLKLKKEIGIITKAETQELERLNRRLGDGRDKIDELKKGFDDAETAVENFKKKIEDVNEEILEIGRNLKDTLADVDRELTKRKGEKVADLLQEKSDLEGQLTRGEGLSGREQERMKEIDKLLDEARKGSSTPEIEELKRLQANIISNVGAGGIGSNAAAKARYDDLQRQIEAKQGNLGGFDLGTKLSGMNELQQIDFEADQRKKELARESNEKQADAVSRLTQATIELAAAEGQVKALKGDLVLAIQDYELNLKAAYLSVEEATNRHVAFQTTKLKEETDAAYALARAYSEVGAFFASEGSGSLNVPSGASAPSVAAGPSITISGNVVINNESDYQALLRRLTRDIQLQTQGSSSPR